MLNPTCGKGERVVAAAKDLKVAAVGKSGDPHTQAGSRAGGGEGEHAS